MRNRVVDGVGCVGVPADMVFENGSNTRPIDVGDKCVGAGNSIAASQSSIAQAATSVADGEPVQVNREAAMWWSDFGFLVVPAEDGILSPTVRSLPTDCDRNYVDRHWTKYPTHEVGFTVGESLLVVCADSPQAKAALDEIEETLGRLPNLIVRTPTGFEHFFWFDKKAHFGPAVACPHNGHIGMKTGKDIVSLPPHAGKSIVKNEACSTSDFPDVGQAFVDVVQLYNRTALPVVADAVGVQAAATEEPPNAVPMSVAGLRKSGERGENGAPTHLPDSTAVPTEAGKNGETGGPATAPASNTAFTTLGDLPTCENIREVSLPTRLTTGPLKSSETCDTQGVGPCVVPGSFMALQAAALEARPSTAIAIAAIRSTGNDADDVFTPKAAENPVVTALKLRDLYLTPLGSGAHKITCLWAHEHTGELDISATYLEPDDLNVAGCFHCSYPHPKNHGIDDALGLLHVAKEAARHKPVIRVVEGELNRVLNAAEQVLEARGQHYQAGGMIVTVTTDAITADPSVVPTNVQSLTRALSVAADFERYVGGTRGYKPCDPRLSDVRLLYNAQAYACLSPLAGLARQPYFREADGVLVTQPGYDKVSKLFGVFDPRQFVLPAHPTKEMAMAALNILLELISEFRFAEDYDRSAALSAMFTAVNRPSLPYAPGFHVEAAVFGSGKSFLCEVISAFAGPAPSTKVSYPSTADEATKMLLALLMKNPAVIEFDDMVTDWTPHGIINSVLTSASISGRILGASKSATVTTRTLFLGSGNNVGPVRDTLRRVATIKVDSRCETPTTIAYKGNPVETLRKYRAAYVAAVLTINFAWKAAGSPRTNVSSIATYGGAWADYCRHPLIWLGLPDPATSLLEQVTHDSGGDDLGGLLAAWYKAFGTFATTVRKAISVVGYGNDDLKDAIHEFPVVERGDINPGKLGYILKRNANRIIGAFKFVEARADGRKAWAVVVVDSAALALSLAGAKSTSAQRSSGTPTAAEIDDSDLY